MLRYAFLAFTLTVTVAGCGSAPPPLPAPYAEADRVRESAFKAYAAGRYLDAARDFREAERRFRSIDDTRAALAMSVSEAEVFLLLGERDHAHAAYERAARAFAVPEDAALAERLALLGARLAVIDGDVSRAREQLAQLRNASSSIRQHAALIECRLQIRLGDASCLDALAAGDSMMAARIDRLRAQAAMDAGDIATARRHLVRALDVYRAAYFRPGIAAVHEALAVADEREGNLAGAKRGLEHALYLHLWSHDRVHARHVLEKLCALEGSEVHGNYRRWQELLNANNGPDWDKLQREVVNRGTR